MITRATTRRGFLIGGCAAALAAALPGTRPAMAAGTGAPSGVLSGRAFGGTWRVVLAREEATPALGRAIAAALSSVDETFSPFRADSEISRFNRADTTGWLEASTPFLSVAAEATRIARASGGAFDPTVGPDVARYGFGPIGGARAGSHEDLALRQGALRKARAGLSLDLCGIAKGHAVSAVASVLEGRGVADFLIEIGGEVTAHGRAPGGGPWRIGIADPVAGGVHSRIASTGLVFATSGDAINAYEVAGRRYSHTIDPATGEPVVNDVASVTVGAPDGATADAMATALLVLGPRRGLDLAEAFDVPALYLVRGGGERAVAVANPQFDALRYG